MKALIEKIGLDKITHFSLGGLITALLTIICMLQDVDILMYNPWRAVLYPLVGTVVTAFVSVLKELLLDSKADWKDVWSALLGSATVYIASIIGMLLFILSK